MERTICCPVCDVEKDQAGQPFGSKWAVACHVAGSISFGNRLHRSWAKQHAPDVDLRQSVPRLAESLLYALRLAIESSRQRAPVEADTPISVLQRFEKKLHRYVRQRLEHGFGVENEAWWVEGVPLKIRQDCAYRREDDPEREEPYHFTYLIDLSTIMEKNWGIFEQEVRPILPRLQKKEFLEFLKNVNDVRNRHAHAVRAPEKGSEAYEADLKLAATAEQLVDLLSGSAYLRGAPNS